MCVCMCEREREREKRSEEKVVGSPDLCYALYERRASCSAAA